VKQSSIPFKSKKQTNNKQTNKQTNQPTFLLPNKQKEKSNKFFVLGIKKTKKIGKKVLLPN
jgi:hypothetical protein